MATPGSSSTPTPLGHEDNLGERYHPRAETLQLAIASWGILNSRRAVSPLLRLVVVERGERPLINSEVISSKLGFKRAKSFCHLHGAQSYG
ncbi:hypothetical protein TNCV_2257861 [Trichonephila clavipes]|nr:hypothetical protein TNCV_2257861 [Trichonephila clavipes]